MLKQKDYEYIIKQDRQLEQYKEAYGKVANKYQGKPTSAITANSYV